jgi:hypothetical protein
MARDGDVSIHVIIHVSIHIIVYVSIHDDVAIHP